MSKEELQEIGNRLDNKREECMSLKVRLNTLDNEYMAIETEWLKASRELENDKA